MHSPEARLIIDLRVDFVLPVTTLQVHRAVLQPVLPELDVARPIFPEGWLVTKWPTFTIF